MELNANLAVSGGRIPPDAHCGGQSRSGLKRRKALEASEQQYRTLVEKMNEGLVMTDTEERILFVNNRMCEIIGMGAGRATGAI